MASNPTKILLYDLDANLGKTIDDLKTFQGDYTTLLERLTKLDVALFDGQTKAVVQDLIDSFNNDFKGHTGERLRGLETSVTDLGTSATDLGAAITDLETAFGTVEALIETISIDALEEDNTSEVFTYDVSGNVIKHQSTGDRAFIVTYVYKTDGTGELATSSKTFTKVDGTAVKIDKTYIYTSGDITGINTVTTLTPPPAV